VTRRADQPRTRSEFLHADGVLVVMRETPPAPPQAKGQPALVAGNPAEGPEILIAIWDDGSVTALNATSISAPASRPRCRRSGGRN
jgi:nicotinate dehydrogenase subunit B